MPNDLYSIKENTIIQATTTSANMCPIKLLKGKPITGITVHLLNEKNYIKLPTSKDILRTHVLANEERTNKHNPSQHRIEPETKKYTSKHLLELIKKSLWHSISRLKEPGFDYPDTSRKPLQDTSTKVTKNQLEQFDTKDVEQEWIPTYQQTVLDNYNASTLDKFDIGHTPNYHHRIKRTTDQPIHVRRFRVRVVDGQVLDEFATNPTAAHN